MVHVSAPTYVYVLPFGDVQCVCCPLQSPCNGPDAENRAQYQFFGAAGLHSECEYARKAVKPQDYRISNLLRVS